MNVRKRLEEIEEKVKNLGINEPEIVVLGKDEDFPEDTGKNKIHIRIVDEPIIREED